MSDEKIRKVKNIKAVEKLGVAENSVLMMYTEDLGVESGYVHITVRMMYQLIDEFNNKGTMTIENPYTLNKKDRVLKPVAFRFYRDMGGYIFKDASLAWTEGEDEEPKDIMTSLEWNDWMTKWYEDQTRRLVDDARRLGFPSTLNRE